MPFNVTWTKYAEPNVTGFYDSFLYFNEVTGNMFGNTMMMGMYVMFLMIFSKWGMKNSFAASSFIMLIISSTLRGMAAISDMMLVFFGLATAISILFLNNK